MINKERDDQANKTEKTIWFRSQKIECEPAEFQSNHTLDCSLASFRHRTRGVFRNQVEEGEANPIIQKMILNMYIEPRRKGFKGVTKWHSIGRMYNDR